MSSKRSSFAKRAYKHINNYIRLQIHLRDGTGFPLTVDVNQTIDCTARLIEAEVTFRKMEQNNANADLSILDSKAIDVYQLYDAADMAIPFSALVKDILKFDDDIYPITSIEDEFEQPFTEPTILCGTLEPPVSHFDTAIMKGGEDPVSIELLPDPEDSKILSLGTSSSRPPNASMEHKSQEETVLEAQQHAEVISPSLIDTLTVIPLEFANSHDGVFFKASSVPSTLGERLDLVLHNKEALRFFKNFCIQEFSIANILFWVEVEAFKEMKNDKQRYLFSDHIIKTYITQSAPLALNLDTDLSKTVSHYSPSTDITLFDDLQAFIFLLIKQSSYTLYENSELFKSFVQFTTNDPIAYKNGFTNWEMSEFTPTKTKLGDRTKNSYLDSQAALLTELHGRYFIDSVEFKPEYFDATSRKLQRRATIGAKKKTPFIIRDTSMDPQKKNKKLHNFFGEEPKAILEEPFPAVGPGSQKLASDPLLDEQTSLTSEGKALLQRKVKKLGSLLGTGQGQTEIIAQSQSTVPALLSTISSTDDFYHQPEETNSLDSPAYDEEPNVVLRKKAEKLAGFFGDHVSSKEMKTQRMDFELLSGIDKDHSLGNENEITGLLPEQIALLEGLSEDVNGMLAALFEDSATANSNYDELDDLSPEERVILQKRAKELASALADVKMGKISPRRLSLQNAAPTVEAARLQKLTQMTGEKIETKDLVPHSFKNGEKMILKRKSSKLEKILGKEAPLDDMIMNQRVNLMNEVPLTPLSPSNLNSSLPRSESALSRITDTSEQERLEKWNQVNRLRKLQKLLGVTGAVEHSRELQEMLLSKAPPADALPQEILPDLPGNLEIQNNMGFEERLILQKRTKKLQEMFGLDAVGKFPPSVSQQSNSVNLAIDTSLDDPKGDISVFDTNEWIEGPAVDKKKKADKLTGFFGYQMTSKELKLQLLVSEMSSLVTQRMSFDGGSRSSALITMEERSILKEILETASDLNLEEQDPLVPSNLNQNDIPAQSTSSLSTENQVLLQKRARELFGILGVTDENVSTLQNHSNVPSSSLNESPSSVDDHSNFDNNERSEDSEVDQKGKASKFPNSDQELKFQSLDSKDTIDLELIHHKEDREANGYPDVMTGALVEPSVQLNSQIATQSAIESIFLDHQKPLPVSETSEPIMSNVVSEDLDIDVTAPIGAVNEAVRLRKLQRMLGFEEGDELTPELLIEIQRTLESEVRKDEEQFSLEEIEANNQQLSNFLTSEEKAVLQKRAKKLHGLLGAKSDGTLAMHIQNQIKMAPEQVIEKLINVDEDLQLLRVHENGVFEKFESDKWTQGQEIDKRKRANKLTGFFGDQLPSRELKLQKLIKDIDSLQSDFYSNYDSDGAKRMSAEHQMLLESIQENAKKLIDNLAEEFMGDDLNGDQNANEMAGLSAEERVALQKRALNLLGIVNAMKEGKPIPLCHSVILQYPTTQHTGLEKATHLMGENVLSNPKDDAITTREEASLARPLSPAEKRDFKKKSSKLERLFGNSVPADAVINYNSSKKDMESEDDINHHDGATQLKDRSISISKIIENAESSPKDDKKAQIMRARKLKKVFGTDEAASITQEAAKQLIEQNQQLAEADADKTANESLNAMSSSSPLSPAKSQEPLVTLSKSLHDLSSADQKRNMTLPASSTFHFGTIEPEQSTEGGQRKQSFLSVVASALTRKALMNLGSDGSINQQSSHQPSSLPLEQQPRNLKISKTTLSSVHGLGLIVNTPSESAMIP